MKSIFAIAAAFAATTTAAVAAINPIPEPGSLSLVALAVAVSLGLYSAWLVTRSITRPLGEAVTVAGSFDRLELWAPERFAAVNDDGTGDLAGTIAIVGSIELDDPDIRAAQERTAALKQAAREPLFRLAPELTASGQGRLITSAVAPEPFYSGTVQLNLGWEIYDGGARYGDRRTRTAQAESQALDERLLRRSVATDVGVALASLRASEATIYGNFGFGMAGDALTATIDSRKPVHFVVHSMGGVLLRAAFASDKVLWERWNSHPGDPRVLMLGTPNQGSHAITLLLTGRDTFFRQLALLDFCHSQEELLKTAIHFPGVMELLPFTDNGDDKAIRELATWEAFKKADGKDKWPLPIADVLAESGKIWRTLGADPLLSSSRLVYVAGMADQTPDKALIDAKGRFQLMATPEGDGRVPWATGIPR